MSRLTKKGTQKRTETTVVVTFISIFETICKSCFFNWDSIALHRIYATKGSDARTKVFLPEFFFNFFVIFWECFLITLFPRIVALLEAVSETLESSDEVLLVSLLLEVRLEFLILFRTAGDLLGGLLGGLLEGLLGGLLVDREGATYRRSFS
mmetsp:Transcript_23793/g.35672  ORF Transcript_23793/g.35672 Transcript_23793/m.35672 type:complete len:152 (+) Transcript_23793:269-724(+)